MSLKRDKASSSLAEPSPKKSKTPSTMQSIIILASGDLEVHGQQKGPGDSTLQYLFRVSSLVFGLISPVFKAMLTSKFREAKGGRICLKEDDAEALSVLFAIAHHRRDLLPQKLSVNELFQLAIIADKYDVVGLLRPLAERHLSVDECKTSNRNYSTGWAQSRTRLCLICWTFGLSVHFSHIYRTIVHQLDRFAQSSGMCWSLCYPQDLESDEYFPSAVLACAIKSREAFLRRTLNLCHEVYNDLLNYGRCKHHGVCTFLKMGSLARAVSDFGTSVHDPKVEEVDLVICDVVSDLRNLGQRAFSADERLEYDSVSEDDELPATQDVRKVQKIVCSQEIAKIQALVNVPMHELDIAVPLELQQHLKAQASK